MGWVENASPEVDAASNYPTIISVCVSMTIFMTAVVSLRVYVRAFALKVMGLDDWTTIFAAVCSIIYNGLCIGQSRWGLGLPIALRPPENLNKYSVINFAGRPFYMIGILGFKVALCLSYLRILSHGQRTYRYIVWSVLIACVLGHVGGTFVLLFQCQPIQKSWIPLTSGSCLANVPTFEALAIVTIAFDVIIFFLPIPVLWNLQMNRRRKIALSGVFLLGLFTTVCSILRMSRIPILAVDGNSTFLVLWGTIEMNVGISLTCVPALGPLFKYFRDKSTPHHNSGRRNPSDASEMQIIEGTAAHRLATTPTEPSLSTPKFDSYPIFSPGQDHDTGVGILSSGNLQTHSYRIPAMKIQELRPQESGNLSIESVKEGGDRADGSITTWPRWSWDIREGANGRVKNSLMQNTLTGNEIQ